MMFQPPRPDVDGVSALLAHAAHLEPCSREIHEETVDQLLERSARAFRHSYMTAGAEDRFAFPPELRDALTEALCREGTHVQLRTGRDQQGRPCYFVLESSVEVSARLPMDTEGWCPAAVEHWPAASEAQVLEAAQARLRR